MKKATHLTSTSVALNRRRFLLGLPLLAAGAAAPQEVVAAKAPSRAEAPIVTYYRTKTIDGIKIFYREAGPANAPVVLLLHGFLVSHVSQFDPGARRPLSRDCPGLPRLRAKRHA